MSAKKLPNGDIPAPNSAKGRKLSVSHATSAPPTPSVHDVASLDNVRAGLAALHAREATIMSRLNALRTSQADLSRELGRLDLLRASLGSQVIATRSISNGMLSSAADTAGRLSNRVKTLDLEKKRVEETLRVVEQVAELKACVNGVVGSMGAPQDWEAAAGYVARASKVPESIIRGRFAANIVPSVEVPDAPWVTLENAKESLCSLFLREFDKAASDGDGAKVTRFFKLFPLIGRGDVGLDVYGKYVCQGVAGTARENLKEATGAGGNRQDGFVYANTLAKLFDHIARIVEGHGGLVERHYGQGKMVRVIERLQKEADVQGGIVLDTWSDERTIDRRITDVKSYPFTFLVQSVLQPQRGLMGTPRMNSPALGGGTNTRSSEDEGVNMKEVDGLLSEMAVMLHQWSLYSRFLAGKCRSPDTPEDAVLRIPELLTKSNLHQKVSGKLITPYNTMSIFFFRRSVEKAFQLDEPPAGLSLNISRSIDSNPPFITSAVDVVMYIVNEVLKKAISTSQREVVGSVITTIKQVLSAEFVRMLIRRMKDEAMPKPAVAGGLPPEDKIVSFIVSINTLDVANDYLSRIIVTHQGTSEVQPNGVPGQQSPLAAAFPFDHDVTFITNSLTGLKSAFTSQTGELISEGVRILYNNVVSARLRHVLSDTFRDVDYTLTEDELAQRAQQNDEDEDTLLEQVHHLFDSGWDAVMKPISRLMTQRTFSFLMEITDKNLSRMLEKRVWSYAGKVNAYGAIRMERDFSAIISTVAKWNYSARELFARITQILMIANMEDDEWEELVDEDGGEDGMQWVLNEDERRRARNLVRE